MLCAKCQGLWSAGGLRPLTHASEREGKASWRRGHLSGVLAGDLSFHVWRVMGKKEWESA